MFKKIVVIAIIAVLFISSWTPYLSYELEPKRNFAVKAPGGNENEIP